MSEQPRGGTARSSLLEPPEPWSGPVAGPALPGLTWTATARPEDRRGWFAKVFQASLVEAEGGDPTVAEVYLSGSANGVVRGLHVQVPPHAHAKTVACVAGAVLDVVVDLRRGSPTEGRAASFRLDALAPSRLHVPVGLAHGFQVLTAEALMAYVVGTEHAPDHDVGVRYDSVEVAWPVAPATVSDRDLAFPPLAGFVSPFTWTPGGARGS